MTDPYRLLSTPVTAVDWTNLQDQLGPGATVQDLLELNLEQQQGNLPPEPGARIFRRGTGGRLPARGRLRAIDDEIGDRAPLLRNDQFWIAPLEHSELTRVDIEPPLNELAAMLYPKQVELLMEVSGGMDQPVEADTLYVSTRRPVLAAVRSALGALGYREVVSPRFVSSARPRIRSRARGESTRPYG